MSLEADVRRTPCLEVFIWASFFPEVVCVYIKHHQSLSSSFSSVSQHKPVVSLDPPNLPGELPQHTLKALKRNPPPKKNPVLCLAQSLISEQQISRTLSDDKPPFGMIYETASQLAVMPLSFPVNPSYVGALNAAGGVTLAHPGERV